MLDFADLHPSDLLHIAAQDSQLTWLGTEGEVSQETAEHLAAQPVAWCVRRGDGSILACFGINETFWDRMGNAVQGVAWALLSSPIGNDHLELTRFVRKQVEECGLKRLELFARAVDIESTLAFFKEHGAPHDCSALVAAAMSDPTPECRWAVALGFEPAHVIRKFGGDSETYMLFERVA